jgi:PAS domain S-box-containing protein
MRSTSHFQSDMDNSIPARAHTILNISADLSFREKITHLLEEAGFCVEELGVNAEGVDRVLPSPYLVLVDLHPSPSRPLELCRKVQDASALPWLPIVHLVSDLAGLDEMDCKADVTLLRSIEPITLISTAKMLISAAIDRETQYSLGLRIPSLEQERDALQVVSDRNSSLLESITDGFYSLDHEWRFTYLNAAAERISHRPREELLGRSVWESFPESVNTPAYGHYQRAVRERVAVTFELFYEPIDTWLEINVYPSPEGVSIYCRDITERKRADETFSTYAAQQTTIAMVGERALAGASLPDLLDETSIYVAHTLDVDFTSVFELQPAAERFVLTAGSGWPEEHIGALTVPAGVHSQFGYILRQPMPVLTEHLTSETSFQVAPLLQEHGVTSDLAVVIQEQGKPYGVLGVHSIKARRFTAQEVTFVQSVANTLAAAIQRRRLEEHLLQSQRTLARAQQIARIGTWTVDSRTGAVYWSDEMYRIFGVRPESFSPNTESIVTRAYPEDRDGISAFVHEALASGVDHYLEHRIVLDDGGIRWIRLQAERSVDAPSGLPRLIGTVLDITERKRGEEALRESQERYQVLFDRSPIPKLLYDDETLRILAVNDAAVEHYGYSREEFLRMALSDLWAPDVKHELPSVRELLTPFSAKVHHVKKDGTPSEVEIFVQQVLLSGRPSGIVAVQDVTERARLEGQLRQAQKMEAVGRLAGGVAHDFNNMLAVIAGYSELLLHLTQTAERQDLRGPLQEIQKASERAARLTRQLLAFSRKQVLTPKVLDLGALVMDFERMLARLIGEDIEVATRVAPDLYRIKADPGQLEQVLLNLVVNGRDAMPTGGKITIEVQNVELDNSYGKQHQAVVPGDYVLLAVTDTGSGMSAETLEHAFEPFFTTKDAEHGTGLGLATVFGIVQQSGGHIQVYSELGIGTTFKVYLPRTRTASEPAAKPQAALISGDATVLLVEDEKMVRVLVQDVLSMYGYTVLAAANGAEALQVVEQLAPNIDLLLTDVVMPGGIGGRQLVEALRKQRPELKVLYMSGYTDDAVVRHGIIEADMAFIQKPFTPVALARKVREVLG